MTDIFHGDMSRAIEIGLSLARRKRASFLVEYDPALNQWAAQFAGKAWDAFSSPTGHGDTLSAAVSQAIADDYESEPTHERLEQD